MTRPPAHRAVRRLRVAIRTTAKRDSGPCENEDSAAENIDAGLFALSDGASAAARAEVWSQLLTEAFVSGADPLASSTLSALRRSWRERVSAPDLAWYAKEKLAQGSAATFLGVRVDTNGYNVTAVGDSCLFHVSDRELVLVAPLTDWREFSRFPELVHTSPDNPVPLEHIWSGGGPARDGDVLLLATDAIAKHLLRQHHETGELPAILDHLGDDEQFTKFVAHAREHGLENDDSTVCAVWT
ncbi:protein phosphatase 2C domain-containing protein [Amycolatopsis keratiniphila]|uniref:protein phosphatase 2C domain-containing protein n=1 Tax=Amycolatopsis keratiniphila TaxID=129921 RepID=UPI00096ED871|nr:protein phosphatase 2C domain-containing protein [Amycolatopsis keratiniphila]OLZ51887.1 hypothetical protein BS330_24905 [Amycolatopsis keratiniphila subsp. nogabecina]